MNFTKLRNIDIHLIHFFRRVSVPLARFGIFLVFFWFGFLKVIGLSPASSLVQQLFEQTIHWMPFSTFLVLFGVLECGIGILFLIRGFERVVIPLLFVHMLTTMGPMIYIPAVAWTAPFVPTLEGQYIIKNIAIIAAAISIAAHLHPIKKQTTT